MFEFDRSGVRTCVAALLLSALASGAEAAGQSQARSQSATPSDASPAPSVPRGPYGDLIARHAARHGIPPALAEAVVRVESRHNARARNGVNIGLTQISYATARRMGYAGGVEGLYDPDTNLAYGIRYLGDAYRLAGGDTCLTVLKYQAGHGAKRMTSASSRYCAKVRTHLAAVR